MTSQELPIIEAIFLALIGLQVFYYFFFAVGNLFYRWRPFPGSTQKARIAVIIPAYREDKVIIHTAQSTANQSYPEEDYEVLIAADSLKPETIDRLRHCRVRVLEVVHENSTKAKSIHKAIDHLADDGFDIALILDADNVMSPNFLEDVNNAFQAGCKAIQGHRTAKNEDSPFAILDAINEEITNSILRRGHRFWGISSATIGSGMAFDWGLFRQWMEGIDETVAEDKMLEMKIVETGYTIHYLEKAVAYDEKISSGKSFISQRRRWVGAQLSVLKLSYRKGFRLLFTQGNLDFFDKMLQAFLIPKTLLIGLLSLLAIFALVGWLHIYWMWIAMIYFLALLFAVPRRFYDRRLLVALVHLPKAILYMFITVLSLRKFKSNKFEVTEKKFKG